MVWIIAFWLFIRKLSAGLRTYIFLNAVCTYHPTQPLQSLDIGSTLIIAITNIMKGNCLWLCPGIHWYMRQHVVALTLLVFPSAHAVANEKLYISLLDIIWKRELLAAALFSQSVLRYTSFVLSNSTLNSFYAIISFYKSRYISKNTGTSCVKINLICSGLKPHKGLTQEQKSSCPSFRGLCLIIRFCAMFIKLVWYSL